MASRAFLDLDAPTTWLEGALPPEDLVATLVGSNTVPIVWPALFAAGDLKVLPKRSADEDVRPAFVLSTPVPRARERLTALRDAVAGSDLGVVWAGMAFVLARLHQSSDDRRVVCDPHEVDGMGGDGELQASVSAAIESFEALRRDRDPAHAARVLPSNLFRSDLSGDAIRARRFTRQKRDRTAFFELAFGLAMSGTPLVDALSAWVEQEPEAPPIRPDAEEAEALLRYLVDHGVVTGEPERWTLQFLGTAARSRSAANLDQVIRILYVQGRMDVPRRGGLLKLGRVASDLAKRILGPPDRLARDPAEADRLVIDRTALQAAIDSLGD